MTRPRSHTRFSVVFITLYVCVVSINGIYTVSTPGARAALFPSSGQNATAPFSASSGVTAAAAASADLCAAAGSDASSSLPPPGSSIYLIPRSLGVFKALPTMAFAFLCHQNAFPIYAELKEQTPERMRVVGTRSMTLAWVVYACAGVFGYLTFLDATQDDLLINFQVRGTPLSVVMDIVRVGFGLALIFSYPVVVWEARRGTDEILFRHRPSTWQRHLGLNIVIVTATAVVGILASGIKDVIHLVGSTCSPMIVFILPALFHLRAAPGATLSRAKAPALAMLIYGAVLIPLCTTLWILGKAGVQYG